MFTHDFGIHKTTWAELECSDILELALRLSLLSWRWMWPSRDISMPAMRENSMGIQVLVSGSGN